MTDAEEHLEFKYCVEIIIDGSKAHKFINKAIGIPGAFNNSNYGEYNTDKFEMILDDECLGIYFSKIDINFIKSIVVPICEELKLDEEDYPNEIRNIDNDRYKEVNFLSNDDNDDDFKEIEDEDEWETIDSNSSSNYETEDDESEYDKKNNLSKIVSLDPEDDCLEDEEKEINEDEDEDEDEYHYCVLLSLIDGMAYRRIADAIGVFDAFPRTQPDNFERFGDNNYGKYKCDKFIIDIEDYHQAEIKFKELDIPYIKSIMNKITDSLLYPRNEYELFDIFNDKDYEHPLIFE